MFLRIPPLALLAFLASTSLQAESPKPDAIAAEFRAIKAEFDDLNGKAIAAARKAKSQAETRLVLKSRPKRSTYERRMVDLAKKAPETIGARDALLWALDDLGAIENPWAISDQTRQIRAMLLKHHAGDVEVARLGLDRNNVYSHEEEFFLRVNYRAAKSHEAKGLALMSLARLYQQLHEQLEADRSVPDPDAVRPPGLPEPSPAESAYDDQLALLDIAAVRSTVESMLRELAKDYGDVVWRNRTRVEVEERLKQPEPKEYGEPLDARARAAYEKLLARKSTLAQVASRKLEKFLGFRAGLPAPEFEGTDPDGKRVKLKDFRGKVVVMIFWGTWCGPCMGAIPAEKALAEKFRGRPLTLLGINCGETAEVAAKAVRDHKLTWPQVVDGESGKIQTNYFVKAYPTVIVIDHKGILRLLNAPVELLDQFLEPLVKAAE